MATIDNLRWVLAVLLGLLWLLFAGGNAAGVVLAVFHRRYKTSFVPIIGGTAGALSLLVCPLPGAAAWAWVPALLDIGCIPALCALCVTLLFRKRS